MDMRMERRVTGGAPGVRVCDDSALCMLYVSARAGLGYGLVVSILSGTELE